MRIKRAAVIAAVVIALAAVVIFAARKSGGSVGKPAGGRPGAESAVDEAKPVRVSAAALKTLSPYIDASGDVEASVNVDVYPDIGGKVVEYKVALGDSVARGEAIAVIDPSKPGSAYALSAVASPIAGTVTSILAQEGGTVASSTSLAKVGLIDDLKVVVKLPERDSAKAAKGMPAKVSFEALPGESFAATVSRVSPVLDPSSRTREISLVFSAKDGRISSGMYAKVRLFTNPVSGQVVIPAAAVSIRSGESFVYVVSEKSSSPLAEKRIVKVGTTVDADLTLLSGVAEGEKVVYEGQSNLADGVKVNVVGGAAE